MPGVVVDGNDPLAVQKATAEAIRHARAGDGPTLIEAKTVRWERHSAFSAGKYDNPEEAQRWKKVDPIPRFHKHLLEFGVSADELAAEEGVAKKAIDEGVKFALASPLAGPESLYEGMFA